MNRPLLDLPLPKERLYRGPAAMGDRRQILDSVIIGILPQRVGDACIFNILRARVGVSSEGRAGSFPVDAFDLRIVVPIPGD